MTDLQILREIARQAALIRKMAIQLGLEQPKDVRLDALYVLSLGIQNRSRRMAARMSDGAIPARFERRAA